MVSGGSPNPELGEVRGEFTRFEVPTVNLQLQTAESNQQLEVRKLLTSIRNLEKNCQLLKSH